MHVRRAGWTVGVVLGLIALTGCGDEESGGGAPLPLDLPVVGTVGDLPPEAERLVIRLTRDGYIRVPGRDGNLSIEALSAWLEAQADAPQHRAPDGSSLRTALLEVDAGTPWVAVQWLMMSCAHPRVRIWKLALAARTPDGATGAVGVALPRDRSGPWPSQASPPAVHRLKVFQRDGGEGPSGMHALAAALVDLQADRPEGAQVVGDIVAPPPSGGRVPYEVVVQMLDACLAAGMRFVTFEGAAMPLGAGILEDAEGFAAHLVTLRAAGGSAQIRVGQSPTFLPPDPADAGLPAGRGRIEGRWGTALEDMPWEEEVEILEEVEEVEEAGPPPMRAGGAFHRRGGEDRPLDDAERAWRARAARAVDRALAWFAAHQEADGSWSADGWHETCQGAVVKAEGAPGDLGKPIYDVGATGLVAQVFLAAGYTHRGRHPYAQVVRKALGYLERVQDVEGGFGIRSTQQYIYNHATAALAMVEAYGMTASPVFAESAQRALDFIALSRNPYFGWRYGIKPGDNDTSVTTWMCLVLHAAERINAEAKARGAEAPLTVDADAWKGAQAWFGKIVDPKTGRAGYVQRGTGPARPMELLDDFPSEDSEAMTAAVCAVRLLHGAQAADDPLLAKGLALVAALPPDWKGPAGRRDLYSWHWGTLAMVTAGGERWVAWRTALDTVIAAQHVEGDVCSLQGSWDPVGPWRLDGGRVVSTALVALCLTAPQRY